MYLSRQGTQVLCLSDGAGSAKLAEFGADVAVSEGCKLLVENFDDFVTNDDGMRVKRHMLDRLLERLATVAQSRTCDLSDLASTFLAIAVSGNRYLTVHVGDGLIGCERDGRLEVVSGPDNAEFANQTTFLTSADAVSSMRLSRGSLDGISGFVVMSDGAGSSLYDWRTQALAPACAKLIAHVGAAPTYQVRNPAWAKQIRKLVDTRIRNATRDDCSIGILARSA